MNTSIFGQIEPAHDEPRGRREGLDEDALELAPGTSVQGKYTVLGVLGHGGFAVVYDAKHDGLGRRVAIKVLHLRRDTPLALLERFRREARISALVRHLNVLEVYDTGALADGSPFLVMERVEGENLAALIRRGPLPIACAVELARQLLRGLSALEERGIVHRDIKPDNLMLHDTGDGLPTLKLVDFGIAKRVAIEPQPRLTCHGALVGTPQYMSPEQIRGEDVDIRTDIYATGAVLYEALTGHAPHESTSFSELVVSVLSGQVAPLRACRANCPPELERIVLKALSPQPAQRYDSPHRLLESLDKFAEAFALPSGAAAFRANDGALQRVRSAKSARVLVHKLGKPLQLVLLVLLLSTPGQVKHVHGATPLTAETSLPATLGVSFDAPLDATVHRVAQASARAFEQRTAKGREASVSAELRTSGVRQPSEKSAGSAEPAAVARGRAVERSFQPAAKSELERSTPARDVVQQAKEPGRPSSAQQASAVSPHEPSAQPGPASPAAQRPPAGLNPVQRRQLDASLQTALAALVRGQLDAARVGYAAAVKLAPGEPAAYRGLGLAAARLGANREARAALGRYLELSPRAPDAAAIRKRLAGLP